MLWALGHGLLQRNHKNSNITEITSKSNHIKTGENNDVDGELYLANRLRPLYL